MRLDFSGIGTIDFHAHQTRAFNLSQWVDSLALSQLESLISQDVLRILMTARGEVFGVKVPAEKQAALKKRAMEYEKSLAYQLWYRDSEASSLVFLPILISSTTWLTSMAAQQWYLRSTRE